MRATFCSAFCLYYINLGDYIYVANDAGPNYLYQNNGNETFSEIGLYANAAVAETGLPQASMGVDFADYD
ncbi:MAG: FG-GAP-like repeat-containing protein, partial [Candidatus Poribacteria bacterium]|nr:FG-GAP-like repeat-containing protein [Candidatus Poribacteria bacterium]